MSTRPEAYPHECYVIVPGYSIIGRVTRGESGYTPCPDFTPEQADTMNDRLGVAPAQREAMLAGSMWGWHVPGADPRRAVELYGDLGTLSDSIDWRTGVHAFDSDIGARRRLVLDMRRAATRRAMAQEYRDLEKQEGEFAG